MFFLLAMDFNDMDSESAILSENCAALRTSMVEFSHLHSRDMYFESSSYSESFAASRTFVVTFSYMHGRDMAS